MGVTGYRVLDTRYRRRQGSVNRNIILAGKILKQSGITKEGLNTFQAASIR